MTTPETTTLYRKLQQNLDRMPVPFPATESGIELRILERLFTAEEAEVALALSMVPELPAVIRRRLGSEWTRARLEPLLEQMREKGVIESIRVRGARRYGKSVLAVGIYERQLTKLTPELQRDVEQYFDEAFGAAFHSRTTPQMRTVPVRIDLTPERPVGNYDDIRSFVRETKGPFAVMDCICRKGKDLIGEPCKQTALRSTCLTFGSAARGMVESGAAQYIEREKTLEILDRADDEGLVLQRQNTEKPWFVCCCCGCCCGVLRSAKQLPEPAAHFSTNFVAHVDAELCAGCADCEARCQMGAVSIVDGESRVDLARCIGCGLCVTSCATGAMRLVAKSASKIPPANAARLYLGLYRARFGTYETALAIGKAVLKRQV
ncbi:MAG: 4Fe-4S dicluster domain-containing protein [Thermoanaerobaculia bacterium]